jgi:hypothetical protein
MKIFVFAKILVFFIFSWKCSRNFVFLHIFVIINNFLEIVGITNIFKKTLTEIFVFKLFCNTFSKHCLVLAVLARLPIGRLVQSYVSLLSCPSCPVPDVLSKTSCPDSSVLSGCPVLAVFLFQLPCQATLATALLTPLSCPGCPVISVISRLTCPGCLSGWPVETVQSRMSFLGCPVLAVLSKWSCPRCHVPNVLSLLASGCSCSLPPWRVHEIKLMYLASRTHGLFIT